MKMKLPLTLLVILALGAGSAYYLIERNHEHGANASHDEHGHDDHDEEESAKGPHGGRLLADDSFTVELAILEQGMPPEFRAWFSQDGQPVAPDSVDLTVRLTRASGVVDTHTFKAEGDYARSGLEVYEPHSFSYEINAVHQGTTHRWNFDAPEMQSTISAAAAARAGLETAIAGPATMMETLPVYGQVKLNANRIARAVPRFSGIVREARKNLGDTVVSGEVVAVVESNQTLVALDVTAPISGLIVDRNVNTGETVGDGAALYTIADLSNVWIDLNVPKRDQAKVKLNQSVTIFADDNGPAITGTIDWISPLGSAEAQTLIARVILDNADNRWRPGLFVKADITLSQTIVPVAVRESALQTLFDFDVVFSQHDDLYQARPLELGRRSHGFVEVLKGLSAGEAYVSENSFLIKADIGKSGASHDH